MKKRILSLVLVLVMSVSFAATMCVTASAYTYNGSAAVDYANQHWNDGVGKCATFVSNCLAAGGCNAWSSLVVNLREQLISGGWGTEYLLTENGQSIYEYQNSGKLSAGDPIFFYCKKCKTFTHVVICTGFNSEGKATASGHNAAWNNVTYIAGFWDASEHKGDDILVYSFHIDGDDINYHNLSEGVYFILNMGQKRYLAVDNGIDENAQNVSAHIFWNSDAYKMSITKVGDAYKMRPLCSASRLINVYADTVVSGKNVNIYNETNHASQWWRYELVGDSFIIRNAQNPSCVLTVDGENVIVSTYTGSDYQKWQIYAPQDTIAYNANGGTGAPPSQVKYHNIDLVLTSQTPVREGYTFLGWSHSPTATQPSAYPSGVYHSLTGATLYAVWSKNTVHTCEFSNYIYNNDATCINNGTETATCSCGKTNTKEKANSATGNHYWGEYISNKNATETADGTKTRTCAVCGHSETAVDVGSKLPAIKDTTAIFTDVAQDWYTTFVNYAYTYGIFKGNEDGTFKPLSNITRAEFVQVLANITGVDTSNKAVVTKFSDVRAGDWFAPAVKWANDNGIVAGKYANQFAPEENITREQMCVMIVNYAKYRGITLAVVEAKEAFADDWAISSWAKDAVYACQMADIVNGKGEGRFDPQGTGLRAEASVIFTKFHQNYLK